MQNDKSVKPLVNKWKASLYKVGFLIKILNETKRLPYFQFGRWYGFYSWSAGCHHGRYWCWIPNDQHSTTQWVDTYSNEILIYRLLLLISLTEFCSATNFNQWVDIYSNKVLNNIKYIILFSFQTFQSSKHYNITYLTSLRIYTFHHSSMTILAFMSAAMIIESHSGLLYLNISAAYWGDRGWRRRRTFWATKFLSFLIIFTTTSWTTVRCIHIFRYWSSSWNRGLFEISSTNTVILKYYNIFA